MNDTPEEQRTMYRELAINLIEAIYEHGTVDQMDKTAMMILEVRCEIIEERKRQGRKRPGECRGKVVKITSAQGKPTARDKANLRKIRKIKTANDFLSLTEWRKKKPRKQS